MIEKNGIKLVSIEDFEDFHRNIAFHYAQRENVEKVFEARGLKGFIGDNSKGDLGKEAVPKVFISYGIEGQMQLFNRLLNAARQITLGGLRTSNKHMPFLPKSSEAKPGDQRLSILESFEMIRNYLDEHIYYVFEASPTKREYEIEDDEIEKINLAIKQMPEYQEIEELDDRIDEIKHLNISEEERKRLREEIDIKRARLSIQIRKKSKVLIDKLRGNTVGEEGIFEEVDFNEEKRKWGNQVKNPHNVHTKIVEDEEGIHGATVSTEGKFGAFSIDGKNIATANEAVMEFHKKTREGDKLSILEDPDLSSLYIRYLEMVRQFDEQGLLIEQNGRKVVDLEHIEMYPGLSEFGEELEEYKVAERKRIQPLLDREKQEKKERAKRLEGSLAESVKILSQQEDVKQIIGEGETTKALTDLEKSQVTSKGVGIGDSN